MTADADILSHRVLAALFNGLYQGLVLVAVLWLGLKLCKGLNAATRHAADFVTLLLVTALPCVHWALAANERASRTETQPRSSLVVAKEEAADWSLDGEAEKRELGGMAVGFHGTVSPRVEPGLGQEPGAIVGTQPEQQNSEETTAAPIPNGGALPDFPKQSSAGPAEIAAVAHREHSTPETTPRNAGGDAWEASPRLAEKAAFAWLRFWPAELPYRASLILLGAVAAIAGLRFLRLLCQCVFLLRLKKRGQPVAAPVEQLCARLVGEMGIGRPVVARESDGLRTPVAIGFLRPMVLLPRGFTAAAAPMECESVLRHELAHLRRHDDWTNLVQQGIAAVLFFHPAVWWLSRRLTTEREIACDDFAFASAGSAKDYALLLAEFAGRTRGRDLAAAPAAWSNPHQLKERIDMLLDPKRNTSTRLALARTGLLTATTFAVATVALLAGPRLVLAEPSKATTVSDAVVAVQVPTDVTAPVNTELELRLDQAPALARVEVSPVATVEARIKENALPAVAVRTSSAVTPTPAPHPVAAPAPRPAILLAQTAPAAPKPPRAAKAVAPAEPTSPAAPAHESLEHRLAQLEKLVHSLLHERAHGKEPSKEIRGKAWNEDAQGKPAKVEAKDLGKLDFNGPALNHHPEWSLSDKDREEITKAVRQAEKEAAKAVKDAEKAMRDAGRKMGEETRLAETRNDNVNRDQHRRAIEQRRDTLEQQMRQLEKQLGTLEEELEELDDQIEKELDHDLPTPVPNSAPENGSPKPLRW